VAEAPVSTIFLVPNSLPAARRWVGEWPVDRAVSLAGIHRDAGNAQRRPRTDKIVDSRIHDQGSWQRVWIHWHRPRARCAGPYSVHIKAAIGRSPLISTHRIGYSLGYWISRAAGLDKNSARTVALEVGIHNGGMATGLASHLGSLAKLGLAAAIFSPWMNVSGSILANYWRRRAERESQ